MMKFDVIVAGVGAMGAQTCWHLARRGIPAIAVIIVIAFVVIVKPAGAFLAQEHRIGHALHVGAGLNDGIRAAIASSSIVVIIFRNP